MKPNLLLGDCREKMRDLAGNSIDAIVTDPPYALTGSSGSGGFMGAKWDSELPTVDMWREALRVAKPGAHLLAFGGTRTYHRLACAIEDAGWEIRDCIMWVYGSGFPKSMDVSKAIDKMRGNSQKFQRMYAEAVRESGLNHADIDRRLGIKSSSCYWVREDDRKSFPTKENWENLKTFLPLPDNADEIYEEAARKDREVSGVGANRVFQPSQAVINPGTPATPEAAAWQGWGTALKPALEPIVVARKPLEGTVAANVLKYGTGAINIDACRVPLAADDKLQDGVHHNNPVLNTQNEKWGFKNVDRAPGLGRFPANLIHDGSPEVLALFPESKGALAPVYGKQKCQQSHTGDRGIYGHYEQRDTPMFPRNDSGSAARFFYCAKASRSERGSFNDHCTVKPLALMRYLVRLVTRKGGIVLDPFMGSGTTGVAAIQEGMNFIGIERDPHYYEISSRRIAAAKPEPPTPTQQELPL